MSKKILLIVLSLLLFVGCATYIPSGYVKISNNPNEKIYKKYDEFNGLTWYQHEEFFNINSNIQIYVGEPNDNSLTNTKLNDSRKTLEKFLIDSTLNDSQKKLISNILDIPKPTNNKYLRCVFIYRGSSWIFFDKVVILNQDGEKMEWTMKSYDKKTNVNSGIVREEYDVLLTYSDAKKLYDFVSSSGTVKLRYSGKYYEDYVLSTNQKAAIIKLINIVYNF